MPEAQGRRPALLCVDDEASIRSALRRVFLEEEWDVLFAKDGEEGLAVCRSAEVDLILSDFRMPGMDGVEFLRKVREMRPDCVRIILSGYADINLIVHALNEGEIYRFLVKPWNDGELLHNVRKALEHQRLGRENTRLNAELRALNAGLERKVDERTEELRSINRTLHFAQVILELLPSPVIGVNRERMVVFANAKARALFERRGTSLVGVRAPDVFEPELSGAIQRALQAGSPAGGGGPEHVAHVLPMVFAGTAVGAIVLTPDESLLNLSTLPPRRAPEWSVVTL
ncbi:MAG: response regulator [Planctomycetaceae bacterium]